MTPVLPATTIWCAAGNNVQLSGDMGRRTLLCRLESPLENPEERPADEFCHPNLLDWIQRERGRCHLRREEMRVVDRVERPSQHAQPHRRLTPAP